MGETNLNNLKQSSDSKIKQSKACLGNFHACFVLVTRQKHKPLTINVNYFKNPDLLYLK